MCTKECGATLLPMLSECTSPGGFLSDNSIMDPQRLAMEQVASGCTAIDCGPDLWGRISAVNAVCCDELSVRPLSSFSIVSIARNAVCLTSTRVAPVVMFTLLQEDCSSGHPQTCNAECAAALVPLVADCGSRLGASDGRYDPVLALCAEATGH